MHLAQCSVCPQEHSCDWIITDAADVPVGKVGGENRCRDVEAELMKGPLTAQVPINGTTNEELGGCPTEAEGAEHEACSQLYRGGLSNPEYRLTALPGWWRLL